MIALMTLSACGGSGGEKIIQDPGKDPVAGIGGVVSNANGTFTVGTGADAVTLPVSNVVLNGQTAWLGTGGTNGGSFRTDDFTVVGGVQNGTPFAGLSGTQSGLPTGSGGNYVGSFTSVTTQGSSVSGPLTLDLDLGDNTLTTASGSLDVDGIVGSNGEITGTASLRGQSANLEGGFYGDSDVAGAFKSDTMGGFFRAVAN